MDGDGTRARPSPADRLLDIISGGWMTQAVYVAAELGIADLLAAGPRTSDDLASATDTHAPSLKRLLRALVTLGLCAERDDGSFEITPTGALLAADEPGSLRAWTLWWGCHLWPVWGELLYSIRTGESSRRRLMGADGFEHLERDPAAAAVFNQALVELSRLTCQSVVGRYDFAGLDRIVDVGGGYGELLACILKAYPSTTGILFDLTHAMDGARRYLAEAGVADRCKCVAGDFFETVPAGGDAYLLQSVIHDWDDDRAQRILKNCRRAIGRDGRLVLIEHVLPDRFETSPAHRAVARSDLTMLVAHAAGERTEATFRHLLASAGFRVTRVMPVGATFSVIEAMPVQ